MQNRRAALFFGLAVLFGFGAAATAKHLIDRGVAGGHGAQAMIDVVVAAQDIPAGQLFTDDDLEIVQWPEAYRPPGAFSDVIDLAGRMPARFVTKGEPLMASVLAYNMARSGCGMNTIRFSKSPRPIKCSPKCRPRCR